MLYLRRVRVALVSREIHPYVSGGVAPIVTAAAEQLAEVAEVTVFTTAAHRDSGAAGLSGARFEIAWVEEPADDGTDTFLSQPHRYSARVHEALRTHYGGRGPDLIEFGDYLAEGFVTMQAKHTLASWLERTLVAVRLHTSAEICSVLNGHVGDDPATLATHDAERFCLRNADRILWPGGDVLETYRRFYGHGLAPATRLPDAFLREGESPKGPGRAPVDGEPLRLLYVGRMERRKGVHNLLRAVTAIERDDWRLTIVGGDTDTGPMGASVARALELAAAGDERISFAGALSRAEVAQQIAAADLVVLPSLWECWPNTARESLLHNRPLLATPVGGLVELARPGRGGFLVEDTTPAALQAGIERCLDRREEVAALIGERGPRSVFDEVADPERLVAGYRALAGEPPPRPPRAVSAEPPLVSVVVPYFELESVVGETLASIAAQTHPAVETVLVVDGSLRDRDLPVFEQAEALGATIVTQVNSGLGAARNLGIEQARGAYVLPLDADDLIDPEYVARCVDVLERDPGLAYVTTWVRYVGPDGAPLDGRGWSPYGNWAALDERNNVAGTCTALFRRAPFDAGLRYSPDLTSYEDWLLYLELHDAGQLGGVIPERLFGYRVREDSMMRVVGAGSIGRIGGEVRALRRERALRWTAAGDGAPAPAAAAGGPAPPPAVDRVAQLETALASLRRANARLARERLGRHDAGAASIVWQLAETRRRLDTEVEVARRNDEYFQAARAKLGEPHHRAAERLGGIVRSLRGRLGR